MNAENDEVREVGKHIENGDGRNADGDRQWKISTPRAHVTNHISLHSVGSLLFKGFVDTVGI